MARPARLPKLFDERNVSGDIPLILLESLPELRSEEFVFDAHTNLRADEEHDEGEKEERQRGHHKASGEQDAKHGGVDGMAHETIRSGHDEFVIGAEAGINAPLASEGAGAGPGKENAQRKENDGERNLPWVWLTLPELALPQYCISHGTDHDAPPGTPVDVLGGIAAALDQSERDHPEKPSRDENGVRVDWHGSDCSAVLSR